MSTLENKLRQIQLLATECLEEISSEKAKPSVTKETKRKVAKPDDDKIMTIVNETKNCKEADKIEVEILDKTAVEGKVLLPFYICHKYFPTYTLTTGDVEKITKELGIRVGQKYVTNKISESLLKYLYSDQRKKHGVPTLYKLNRKGVKHFESLLKT